MAARPSPPRASERQVERRLTADRPDLAPPAPHGPGGPRGCSAPGPWWRWSRWSLSSTTSSRRACRRGASTSSPPTRPGSSSATRAASRARCSGTIEIVGLATLIAVPIGIGVAIYLTEYGSDSRFASAVRYFVDVMTGVPSIVFGLFIYIALVVTKVGGSGFAGWKGAVALALLMLPIVTRSAEVVLELVPDSPARGCPCAGRAALAGDHARGAAGRGCRASSRACCWRSPGPRARPRRCSSRPRS